MKKTLLKTIALTSILTMAFPFFTACFGEKQIEATSYVAIDVNPSLSLTLDKDDKVISVHASNEDAQVMLYGEALEGLKLEVALEKIASLSVDLGYVNEDNYGVNLSVSGTVGEKEILAKLQTAFNKESGELAVNVSTGGTFSDARELEAIKQLYSDNAKVLALTVEEYKLIAEAQAVNGALSIEKAVNMRAEELMDIIADKASKIQPYATEAYNVAVGIAERTYNELKGQLIDSMWIVPYTKDYLNVLTGRKYSVNHGALYNLYTASSRVLAVTIDVMETTKRTFEQTAVSTEKLQQIASTLNLTEEQANAFISEVTVDGKATLATVESYLNRWLKNLTAEQRAQAQTIVNTLIAEVQEFAVTIENSIAKEYKDALIRLAKDVSTLIPEEVEDIASAYMLEFGLLVQQLSSAVEGKEPLAAVKAVKETLDSSSTRIMNTMRSELTKEDLKSVEASISLVNTTLSGYEKNFADAKAEAEAKAKAWLESAKASRKAS